MKALHHTQGSQRRIAKAFHKKVKIRHVQQGDLVLKENRAPPHDPRGKFKPNWGEPYVVKARKGNQAHRPRWKRLRGRATELLSMPRVPLKIFASSSHNEAFSECHESDLLFTLF